MKKLAVLFICALLLSACSPKKAEKSMVVYYSDDDGIEELATKIADHTDSELFRIVPKKDYSSLNEKIDNEKELSAEEIKDMQSTSLLLEQSVPDDWDECDTIYIGFPVSSVIVAPAPVALFLSQNDLKNKTFIPFTIGTQDALDHARESLTFNGARKGWEDGKAFPENYTDLEIEEWVHAENEK